MFSILNRYISKRSSTVSHDPLCLHLRADHGAHPQPRRPHDQQRVDLRNILKLILFLMPALLLFTIPLALIICHPDRIGRLSRDNEYTVLRPAVEPSSDRSPVLAAALIAFFMAALTSFFLIPKGKPGGQKPPVPGRKAEGQRGDQGKGLQRRLPGYRHLRRPDPRARRFHGRGASVRGDDERRTQHDHRLEGHLVSNPQSLTVTLRLENGSIPHRRSRIKNYKKIDFSTYDVRLDFKGSAARKSASSSARSTR